MREIKRVVNKGWNTVVGNNKKDDCAKRPRIIDIEKTFLAFKIHLQRVTLSQLLR